MARKLQLLKKSVGILIPNECSFLTRAQDKFLREVQFQHHPLLPNSEKHELQCLRCCYLPTYLLHILFGHQIEDFKQTIFMSTNTNTASQNFSTQTR